MTLRQIHRQRHQLAAQPPRSNRPPATPRSHTACLTSCTASQQKYQQLQEVAPSVRARHASPPEQHGPESTLSTNQPPCQSRISRGKQQQHARTGASTGRIGLTIGREGDVCQAEVYIEGQLVTEAITDTGASDTCISQVMLRA
jgi:hypothetical protein